MEKDIILKIISELGFPILVALIFGIGIFLAFKFILLDMIDSIKRMHNITHLIEQKIKRISHDIAVLDILVSSALNVKPDFLHLIHKLDKNND